MDCPQIGPKSAIDWRKNAAPIKIGAAISGPIIADKNFTDTRIFLRKGVLDKRFMSKFLGVSFLSFANKKGTQSGTLCGLFSSHSFPERLECSEKAFHVEVPWGVPSLFRLERGPRDHPDSLEKTLRECRAN